MRSRYFEGHHGASRSPVERADEAFGQEIFMGSFSLRLTHKIAAIGIVGVAGVILTGGIHFYGESATAVHREAAGKARAMFELNSKIEIGLLEGRRAEKDFLLRNDAR